MSKCKSYHTRTKRMPLYNRYTGHRESSYEIEVGVCWGTAECDECNCGGDRAKCDFYPEEREKAIEQKRKPEARWKGAGMGDYTCSYCGETFSGGNRFRYCPNCGTLMYTDKEWTHKQEELKLEDL